MAALPDCQNGNSKLSKSQFTIEETMLTRKHVLFVWKSMWMGRNYECCLVVMVCAKSDIIPFL
jgi:hypothetical protein